MLVGGGGERLLLPLPANDRVFNPPFKSWDRRQKFLLSFKNATRKDKLDPPASTPLHGDKGPHHLKKKISHAHVKKHKEKKGQPTWRK